MVSFWSAGMIFGLLKETALIKYAGLYTYSGFHLMLAEIPLVYVVLWSNLSYVGLMMSENYLGRGYLSAKPMDYHLPLVFLTLVLTSFMLDVLYSTQSLIEWHVDSRRGLWSNTPILAPISMGFSAVVFLKSFKNVLQRSQRKNRSSLVPALAIQPVVVLILSALLLLTNLLIILIFPD